MSLEFTNTNLQHVRDANAGSDFLNGLTAVTVSIWVKSDATGVDDGFIVSEAGISDDYIQGRYDAAGHFGSGTNVMKFNFNISGSSEHYETASNIQTVDWQHVLFGWSSGTKLWCWVDGVIDSPTYQAGPYSGSLTNITSLLAGRGGWNSATGGSWDGLLADFRIYNRILADDEKRTLHALRGGDGIVDGLLVRWLMDENAPGVTASGADLIRDRTPNARHGTPNASPTFGSSILTPVRQVA